MGKKNFFLLFNYQVNVKNCFIPCMHTTAVIVNHFVQKTMELAIADPDLTGFDFFGKIRIRTIKHFGNKLIFQRVGSGSGFSLTTRRKISNIMICWEWRNKSFVSGSVHGNFFRVWSGPDFFLENWIRSILIRICNLLIKLPCMVLTLNRKHDVVMALTLMVF